MRRRWRSCDWFTVRIKDRNNIVRAVGSSTKSGLRLTTPDANFLALRQGSCLAAARSIVGLGDIDNRDGLWIPVGKVNLIVNTALSIARDLLSFYGP